MFRIGEVPVVADDVTLELASRVQPSTVGHGRDRGLAHGIRPMTSARRMVGTVFTVRVADMDATPIHYAADLLQPGHVLVVDMGGDRDRASVGGILTFLAHHRGAAGIVVDGMATDLAELEQIGLPVYARGISAMTTRVLGVEGDVNLPIVIDGVVVSPGDLVIGDADGLLFLHDGELDNVASSALAAQDFEVELKKSLTSGTSLSEVTGARKAMEGKMYPLPSQHTHHDN